MTKVINFDPGNSGLFLIEMCASHKGYYGLNCSNAAEKVLI